MLERPVFGHRDIRVMHRERGDHEPSHIWSPIVRISDSAVPGLP